MKHIYPIGITTIGAAGITAMYIAPEQILYIIGIVTVITILFTLRVIAITEKESK